ncbi:MAG: manganese efflux pump, partial [Eubacterium sp.]|nr:manganese efflux pump [Eubacterium sp.]
MNIALFVINSILLGVGLAMDAFSISIANGLNEPDMSHRKTVGIAGTYAIYQFLMPMIGWFCVHTIASYFVVFQRFIPWIALGLLAYIGGKMLFEGIGKMRGKANGEEISTGEKLTFGTLMLQGIATSIDALSVGFTIAAYKPAKAFVSALIIAIVTFAICMVGLLFGKKFGEKLAD